LAIFVALLGLALSLVGWLVGLASSRRAREPDIDEVAERLSILPERFIIYDLETTGLDPARHEIIEVGAIRVHRDSDVHDTFQTFVLPTERISARITEITGITREMVKAEGKTPPDALQSFSEFVGDLPLIAFNSDFDRSFLRASCRRVGLPPITNVHWCALAMARQAWPGRSSYRLSDLARDGGLKTQTHRALDDCQITLKVYISAALTIGTPRPGRLKSRASAGRRAA
jgi:DNA polymerase III epsilon subunit family exonuclease